MSTQLKTQKPLDNNNNERDKILNNIHLELGHGSTNEMKYLIGQKYYWTVMHKHIDNWVASCKICLKAGRKKINRKNFIIRTEKPNEL